MLDGTQSLEEGPVQVVVLGLRSVSVRGVWTVEKDVVRHKQNIPKLYQRFKVYYYHNVFSS